MLPAVCQLSHCSEGDGAPLAWLISTEIGYFLEPALFVSRIGREGTIMSLTLSHLHSNFDIQLKSLIVNPMLWNARKHWVFLTVFLWGRNNCFWDHRGLILWNRAETSQEGYYGIWTPTWRDFNTRYFWLLEKTNTKYKWIFVTGVKHTAWCFLRPWYTGVYKWNIG